jgi:hypothetical protein
MANMTSLRKLEPASLWPVWRRLYPLYSTLAREFVLETLPCQELEQEPVTPTAECVTAAQAWFSAMDQRIQVHHLRQFGQTSSQMNEDALRDFVTHHLHKQPRSEQDRDKIDFLLVQFFAQVVPQEMTGADLTVALVGKTLAGVLGPAEADAPDSLESLNELLHQAAEVTSLKAMFTARIIERGREIKTSCGDNFFEPITLAAFTRFGFLIRRVFFRLMQQDLNVISDGLRELESRGVTTLDCRKAQFAADEPIARLRMICQSWRVMFHAEYSSGQPLCILVDLRTAVEHALAQSAAGGHDEKPKAMAAVAGATAASSSGGMEFEVSVAPLESELEQ